MIFNIDEVIFLSNMSKKRNKNYIQRRKHNPVFFGERINQNKEEIEKMRRQKDMMYAALERHIEYLTNFTSHDIKNAIQNMDSAVSSLDLLNVTAEDINTIKTCLGSIRSSLQNFASLVPNSTKTEFYIKEICIATELINKPELKKNAIKFESNYDKKVAIPIIQPYHSLLQVLNNLIINSIKSFEKVEAEKIIRLDCYIKENNVELIVCDTGCGIENLIRTKIFDMYFSNTNGSGIGLYHAKYLIEKLGGKIELAENFDNFTTVFRIILPIQTKNEFDTNN